MRLTRNIVQVLADALHAPEHSWIHCNSGMGEISNLHCRLTPAAKKFAKSRGIDCKHLIRVNRVTFVFQYRFPPYVKTCTNSFEFFQQNWERTQENSSCAHRRPRVDQLPLCGSTSVGTLCMSWHTIRRSGITSLEGYVIFKVHCKCGRITSNTGMRKISFCVEWKYKYQNTISCALVLTETKYCATLHL